MLTFKNSNFTRTIYLTGVILYSVFILVVMIDPTNTILHKKDIFFILTTAYNVVILKPDYTKLPLIIIMASSIVIPWILASMMMFPMDDHETLAVFKSISPIVLLLWVKHYNLIKLAKPAVIICCFLSLVIYICINVIPELESVVWIFMDEMDNPIMMSRRSVLGINFFGFYLKSCISFVFVMAYYLLATMKGFGKKKDYIYIFIITGYFLISGTRSTMLLPFFLFAITAFRVFNKNKYTKYIMLTIANIILIAFCLFIVAAVLETDEISNSIKYAHINSYMDLFEENPLYFIIGQGPGSCFYTEGFDAVVYKTEWAYLDLFRCYGIFAFGILYIFISPITVFWKYRSMDDYTYCAFWAYLSYLLIAGTNPLLLSSTGLITLLMAYSYIEIIKKTYIGTNCDKRKKQ